MRNCLIVLQPRNIARALETIDALPVDKAWFRAFSEPQLVEPINRFIRDTDYDAYAIVADDVIVTQRAWGHVVDLVKHSPDGATGWCQLARESPWTNAVRAPLRLSNGQYPVLADYDFYHREEIRQFADPVFQTWFGGWSLTLLPRELWHEFPFRTNASTGGQSDFETFFRLGRPILTHREAEIEHLKVHVAGVFSENVLVGKESPSIRFEKGGR